MLAEAIESVLNQRNVELEVILIDDCSTDGTEEFVRSIHDERIRYFRNEKNSGQDYSRMIGFREVRGKYITFLDDDDYYTDYDFFSKAVNIFCEHKDDEIPVVMVCANAEVLNISTNESRYSDIGKPGRVKGIDFILNGKEYRKPPSVFPAVFKADALRKAGLEDMLIFDTMTYIQAAIEGDAWFMSDVIGVYRVHGNNHSKGMKNHKADDARHYHVTRENLKRTRLVKEKLQGKTERKIIERWYINYMLMLNGFYAIARPGIKDRIKIMNLILSESGFMPKLWMRIMLSLFKGILKTITPLRRVYKKIKYGDSHYGEH